MRVQKAVKVLTKALKDDPGFYLSYQSNIAMAFQDEWDRQAKLHPLETADVHKVANNAAKNFLNMWIYKL
jgi:hypothetical protein